MSRAKLGSKTGRRERHMALQSAVKAAKKLRRERAARFAHLPGQQPAHGANRVQPSRPAVAALALADLSVGELRVIAQDAGGKPRSRDRKADLITMIEAFRGTECCSYCGGRYPAPVALHHSEDECAALS